MNLQEQISRIQSMMGVIKENELTQSNDISFNRRKDIIRELIDKGIVEILNSDDICDLTFSEFLTEVAWQVSDNPTGLGFSIDTDQQEMIPQIHKWVRRNFSLYIREEYDNLLESEGCNDFDDDDYNSSLLYGVDNN